MSRMIGETIDRSPPLSDRRSILERVAVVAVGDDVVIGDVEFPASVERT